MAMDVNITAETAQNVTSSSNNVTSGSNSTLILDITTITLGDQNLPTQSTPQDPQWLGLGGLILVLASLISNGAFLGLFWKASHLHDSYYGLLASLALIGILNSLVTMPFSIFITIYGRYNVNIKILALQSKQFYLLFDQKVIFKIICSEDFFFL